MNILRLKKIKNHRIFRDFSWPSGSVLPDFATYNVIYGWNGVGKTTLSNIFRHIERRQSIVEGEISVLLEGDVTVQGESFESANLPRIKVFNRDFIKRSIFEQPNEQLPPVYYLGEDSADAQRQVEELKTQLNLVNTRVSENTRDLTNANSAIEKFRTDKARTIKTLLTAPSSAYNNYNAGSFRIRAEELLEANPVTLLNDADRNENLEIIKSSVMASINRPTQNYPDFKQLTTCVNEIVGRSIVSSVIQELQDNPKIASWVNDGLVLHKGNPHSLTCHFCKQSLPLSRINQLDGHFNDAYSNFLQELDRLIAQVDSYIEVVSKTALPAEGLLYANLRQNYIEQVNIFTSKSSQVSVYLSSLKNALSAKRNQPFKVLKLETYFTSLPADLTWGTLAISLMQSFLSVATEVFVATGKAAFDAACSLIDQHNHLTSSFRDKQIDARKALENNEIAIVLGDYEAILNSISNFQQSIESEMLTQHELTTQITDLERSIRQHQPAAEELTKDMASYLGRNELEFVIHETGYEIRRRGEPALHLSEGERTAVAFIYFLKTLQDTSFDLVDGIVVIDDPVSSLDSNSLYSAFGFMKERIKDAGQIFIFTHNFTFFRQVKNWFGYIARNRPNKVRFYMLKSRFQNDERSAYLTPLDELLRKYESEYHHLFSVVIQGATQIDALPMESYYPLPNVVRRLLEAFLAFKEPAKTGELSQQLRDIDFDIPKKERIVRFTNTYSHHGLMPEPAHDMSVLAEAPQVAKDVLLLIKQMDRGHFDSMTLLCGINASEEILAQV
jgi:wobble nucleotide-excising tRNase